MVVVSRSGTEYPRSPTLCEETLQGRELVWSILPNMIYQGAIPCLKEEPGQRLDLQRGTPAPGEVLQGHGVPWLQ